MRTSPKTRAEIAEKIETAIRTNTAVRLSVTETRDLLADSEELERYKAFAEDIMKSWPEGDVDGGDLQDAAIKHGLLIRVQPTEPCADEDEGCACREYYDSADFGTGDVVCYRRTSELKSQQT